MADDPRLGATLSGKYQLTRLIGRGGFGSVYEGMNLELEKRVAVKLIEPQYVRNEEIVARFRVEARAASRVESEHIVQVFDVGSDPSHGLYMVMELLHGEDLASRLDRELKLSPAVAVHVAVQAARGLAKAHAAGVVHRDLKPANVFLVTREDGSLLVKLVDFGISKLLARGESTSSERSGRALTLTGTAVGTPNYMSPEQARGLQVDGRTDVWALGALLYEMLAGTPAYPHELSYEEIIIAIVTAPEPRLGEIAPWVPNEVVAVVDKALTRDLVERVQDCGDLARRLSEAMPNATRPRREESLYMEPSDYSGELLAVQPLGDSLDTGSQGEMQLGGGGASRAETTIATAITTRRPEPKRAVWPWLLVPAVLGAGAFGVWKSGFLAGEEQPVAPAETASVSTSAPPSASTSIHPRPIAHPKPKPSVSAKATAKPSATSSGTAPAKPSAKPSVSG